VKKGRAQPDIPSYHVKQDHLPPKLYQPASPIGNPFIGSSRPAFTGFNFDFERNPLTLAIIENERKKGVHSAILRGVSSDERGL
jgi:hypothetical protein